MMIEQVGTSLWDARHGNTPVYDFGTTTTLPTNATPKRIRPRPIAISRDEAIAYRDNPPIVLARTAKNIHEVVDGVPYHRRRGMDCPSLREPVTCPLAKVGDVLYLREAWSTHAAIKTRDSDPLAWEGKRYSYRADWPPIRRGHMWSSATCMPLDAARNLRKVTAIECKQARDTNIVQRVAAQLATPRNFEANGRATPGWYYAAWCWVITLGDVGV